MSARRTSRQILLDAMGEDADFLPEVDRLVQERGGRCVHVWRATVAKGRMITPTSSPLPDLFIWFPGSGTKLHVAELKAYGKNLSPSQAEQFESMEAAGIEVPVWWPRDLDEVIPTTLDGWAG